jgi:hypothetical protein
LRRVQRFAERAQQRVGGGGVRIGRKLSLEQAHDLRIADGVARQRLRRSNLASLRGEAYVRALLRRAYVAACRRRVVAWLSGRRRAAAVE